MFTVESVQGFLSQIALRQIGLFILVLFCLSFVTSSITTIDNLITKAFPHRRMAIFSWIPLFNLGIYVVGFLGAFSQIFNPSESVYLGFIASILVGVTIASQDIFKSIIAGFVILVDKPFQVGDRITFQNDYGEVISIGLRSVKIRTLDGNIVTIPNHRFIGDLANTSSAGKVEMVVSVDIYLPSSSDLVLAKQVLERIAHASHYVNTTKPIMVVAQEFKEGKGEKILLITKCTLKDDRFERDFQSDFVITASRELKALNLR